MSVLGMAGYLRYFTMTRTGRLLLITALGQTARSRSLLIVNRTHTCAEVYLPRREYHVDEQCDCRCAAELRLRREQMRSFPFCPDHRDKVRHKPCRECEIERLNRVIERLQGLLTRGSGMTITEEQRKQMLELAKPLIKWLNENCNPHCELKVDQNTALLLEGIAAVQTNEYLRD